MSNHRLLAALVLSLAPACGPGKVGDSFREGEPCDGSEFSAPCRLDGERGYEFCESDWEGAEGTWSLCLTEECEKDGETRECEGGTQYCTSNLVGEDFELRWGACVEAPECKLGESASCFGEEFGIPGLNMYCTLNASGVPSWDFTACNTPLVLSFGAAIEYAPAPTSAANFDMHGGAGACVRSDWPSAATPWLALDRDRNGAIDGGHELFGTGTRLAAGSAAHNGFVALAELDSDGDGRISPADDRWDELVLWADHDGDRRSSGWELLPLASFEIVAVELGYTSRRACDGAGNCGIERASFVYRSGGVERTGEVVDVHLACE